MERIAKFVVRKSRYWKFRYAIIEKNARKCYVSCGISEKDISSLHYFSTGNKILGVTSVKAREQGLCLAKCYVNYTVESIDLLCKSYFVCLKKTGEYSQVQNLKGDDTLKILSGLKLSNTCSDFYKEMRTLFDEFNDLLDFVFGKNENEKKEHIQILKNKIIQSRNEISRTNNLKRYN